MILRFILKWIFYLFPFFLFGIFLILFGVVLVLKEQIQNEAILSQPLSLPSSVQYPILTVPEHVVVSAKTAIVMDLASHVVVYTKNPNLQFSPASTTKIMTALVGLKTYNPDDVLTVKGPLDPEGSGLGLLPGQKITFRSLLYGMFLPSANDAAQTVAQNYPGGETVFIDKMNATAKAYHLDHTHFGDPAGLDDDNDYTTVIDLAHLTAILIQNPLIRDIVKQKAATITTVDKSAVFDMKSRNILLGFYGIDGVKTGYTDGAKDVLVTSVTRGNHKYIVIVMNSDDRFADTLVLVKNILPHITYMDISL